MWLIQGTSCCTGIHQHCRSRLHQELLTRDHWHHTMRHTTGILMWLINKWDFHTIDVETEFLYAVLEELIYTNTPKVTEEVLEE